MLRIELILPNLPVTIGPAAVMAQELARRVGFSETDAVEVRTAVDEGCAYVLGRAFAPNERGEVRLVLELESRGLRIRILDRGLPLNPEALERRLEEGSTLPRHLGVRVLRAVVDEVSFRHLGRSGNEITMLKRLKGKLPRTLFHELERIDRTPTRDEVVVRRARPEEAVGISRCIYRSYGYTYTGEENAYSPEWLAQMNRSQTMVSAVTVAGDEVVGHVALLRMDGPRSVYDLGQGAVDPAYRSRGLLKRMMAFLLEQAEESGLEMVYADPVTTHTHSQKAVREFGFIECGLLLACVAAQGQVRGMEWETAVPGRVSLLPCVKPLKASPPLALHLPEPYRDIVKEGLQRCGLDHGPGEESTGRDGLSWGVRPLVERGFIRVPSVGTQTSRRFELAFRDLLAERVAVIHLDLNLVDPGNLEICRQARNRGFFYAAVLPGLGEGLTLRLQYLNQLDLDPTRLKTLTDWGSSLREFVLSDRQRLRAPT